MYSGTITTRLTSWRRWVPSGPRSRPAFLFNSSTSRPSARRLLNLSTSQSKQRSSPSILIGQLRTSTTCSKNELPEDRAEAERIARRSRRYVVVGGEELYRRGTSGILMRCISEEDGRKLLKEIHSGICGNHAASRTLVGKTYRQGFFWPTTVTDADELIRKCEGC